MPNEAVRVYDDRFIFQLLVVLRGETPFLFCLLGVLTGEETADRGCTPASRRFSPALRFGCREGLSCPQGLVPA